jgi:phosphoribulokinase
MAATPVLIGVVGDSGSGKTTISSAIAQRLGLHDVTAICLDDYHKYDRAARTRLDITALSPECNRLDLMAEHLHAMRRGETITKPVYDHTDGTFGFDETITPRGVVIARGLLGLYTPALRAAFDLTVYLEPDEVLRTLWKSARDTAKRGYTREQVRQHLDRREPDAVQHVRPQHQYADVVIGYSPSATGEPPLTLRVEHRERDGQANSDVAVRARLLDAVLAAAERARWPFLSDVPRPVTTGGGRR